MRANFSSASPLSLSMLADCAASAASSSSSPSSSSICASSSSCVGGGPLRIEVVLGVRVDQAVDHLVDAQLVLLHLVGEVEDLLHRGRAGADRQDHVAQAVLDALGDLDLALAREQLDRAHLAHVHAHRVGGAAEFGIDRRERGLGLLLDVLVGLRHRLASEAMSSVSWSGAWS